MSPFEVRPADTLPPVSLTPEQAAAVVAALAEQGSGGPYSGHGLAALMKVLEVLEPDARRRADLFATGMLVGAEADDAARVRAVIEQAVVHRRVLVLRYRDGKGTPSHREVEPQLLARTRDHWYLVAWCRERQAPRWFRLDRVAGAEATGEPAPRRDPALFGAPSDTHPAGRALDRGSAPPATRGGLRALPGGKQ